MRAKHILTKDNFTGEHPLCSYVQAYLKLNNLKVGDSWDNVDYMFWIDKKHDEFRKLHRLPEHITLNDSQVEQFLHFIGYYD
jgi:hypothetical protein